MQNKNSSFLANELFMQTWGGRNGKAPLYGKTGSNKNANNVSFDYGSISSRGSMLRGRSHRREARQLYRATTFSFVDDRRRPSQKNQKDLLDMTNYQVGRRNLVLDNQENVLFLSMNPPS